jgi:hypothetical protein
MGNATDDYPVNGKVLYDTTGTANDSDTSVNSSGTKGKDGTTFVSTGLGKDHYRPVESYEGIHRYDPDFVWEKTEEKRLVRKVCGTVPRKLMTFKLNSHRSINAFVPGLA